MARARAMTRDSPAHDEEFFIMVGSWTDRPAEFRASPARPHQSGRFRLLGM